MFGGLFYGAPPSDQFIKVVDQTVYKTFLNEIYNTNYALKGSCLVLKCVEFSNECNLTLCTLYLTCCALNFKM